MSDHRRPFGDDGFGDDGFGDERQYDDRAGGAQFGDDGFVTSRFAAPRFEQSQYGGPEQGGYQDQGGYQGQGGYADPGYEQRNYDDAQSYGEPEYYEQASHYDETDAGAGFGESDRAVPEEISAGVGRGRGRGRRNGAAERRAKRGKWFGLAAAAVVLVVLAGLVVVGGKAYFGGPDIPDDFAGPGGPDVIVEVKSGDTAEQIAETMLDKGVVASTAAFYNAAVQNPKMNAMHPGFYSISSEISGVDAVSELVDPTSRVGQMVISEGRQLHDATDVNTNAVKKGIYTLISEASCMGDAGNESCIGYEDLNEAGSNSDLTALGVPEWAKSEVSQVPDSNRQLEGLIAAGSWNFDPTASPTEILKHLVSESAARYEDTGIETAGDAVGLTPYQMLIAASLVEREALPADFSRVARVILNRLDVDMPLQFDSTVNYSLDTTELATTDADRARVTPWNTYASPGLPATPIASPSIEALQASESPEPGDWIYFVTIDAQGTTLFTKSYEQHLSNITLALNSGILNSGR
ncbi:MAG: aminodeoxychorismate lyase [Rhodococcus sp.]|nr:aminodeoxychorismate lyase [Rhodococcus sp. (in: high G+C Gram-positive bacteria)]